MFLLYLIRHATCEPVGRRLAGRAAGVSLDARGEEEARRLADRLAGSRLDAVYSSPLERSRQTAERIAGPRGLEVRVVEGLQEVDFGGWTGRTFAEMADVPEWRRFNEARSLARPPGGESIAEVQARAVAAVDRLARAHPGGAAAAVSHGDVIRGLVLYWLGMPADFIHRLEIGTASVTVARLEGSTVRILRLNDTGAAPGTEVL